MILWARRLLQANMSLTWTEASAKDCHRNDNWETDKWVESGGADRSYLARRLPVDFRTRIAT